LQLRIVLAPNCSLTPRTATFFFLALATPSLMFALFFVLQGLWPILPFWGLEMLVLAIALHLSLRQRHYREEVLLTDSEIRIISVSKAGEAKQEFSRHWARVKLRSPQTKLRPSRLVIESHGRSLEIGSFLTEEARRSLAQRLHAMVGPLNESPPLDVAL
jgi:uncharacterized membrane protein